MEKSDQNYTTDDVFALKEGESNPVPGIYDYVEKRFQRAKTARDPHEQRWLRAYRNYRGVYGPDMAFTDNEKSRVFIKVTKTKTLAAYGRITDVLFANNTFPLSIDPTTLPEGVVEAVHIDPQSPPNKGGEAPDLGGMFGYKGDGKELKPGTTTQSLFDRIGSSLKNMLGPVKDQLKEGVGTTPSSITFRPAEIAAKKMEKKIKDQLEESDASQQLRATAFDCALYGTGIMCGPFAVDREYPRWVDGKYDPIVKVRPKTEHVPIWEAYPDPDATCALDMQFFVRRHKMTRTKLASLKKRPGFRKDAIDELLMEGENYVKEYWEDELQVDNNTGVSVERFEVKEYWGNVDLELLERENVTLPEGLSDNLEELQMNVWFSGGKILRLVVNPFKPVRIPFYVVPYELNPYSIFGVGIAENMDDTQTLMNGFLRLAVDNSVLAGNLIFEIDETNLVPGQDLKVYPGKVFRRQGGAPGQAIFGTKFPNVANDNLQLFDKARQLADESTGFPSFAHGQPGVQGVGRTAAGMSMQMNAASGNIKTVVKNIDDYLLKPLGEAFFYFNNQFDYDAECDGDLEVKARGTESLMQNEVRSQRLLQFLQVMQNPQLMPFAKLPYIVREIAKSLDLDPDLVANNMDQAAVAALILQKMNPQLPPAPAGAPAEGAPSPSGNAAGMAAPSDMTGGGGGNIGVGAAATPGEQGFSGQGQRQ